MPPTFRAWIVAGALSAVLVALAPQSAAYAVIFFVAAVFTWRWVSESGLLSVSHLSRAALFLVCGVGLLLPVSLAVAGYTRKALAGTPGDAVLVAAAFVLVSLTALRWPRRLGDKAFLVMSAVLFLIAKLAFVHVVVKAPEGDLANYWRLATVVAEGGLEALEHEDDYNLMLVPRIFPYFLPLVHFFGPEASSFRIANVLATILSAGLAYTFASDHFGKRPARLTFALSLLAFDPWLTSTVSSHDIPGTLYTLAALLAYSKIPRALGAARRRAALLYSIAFGVLTYLANLQRNVGIFLLLACFLVAILSMLGELRGKWPHLGRGVLFFILLPAVLIKGLALAYDATDLPAHERGDDIYLLTMGFSDSWHDGTFLFYEASYLMKGFTTMPEAQSPRFPLHKLLSDIYYNPGERLWSYLRKAKSFYTFERSDHYYLSDARLRGQGAMTDRQKKRLVVVRAFFIVPFFLLFLLGSVAVWERRRLSLFAFLPLVYMAFLSGPLIVLSEIQPRYLYPLWFIAAIYIGALFMERGRPAAARPDGGLDILHVYKDYPPVLGGIELHLRLLAEAQARRGHRVTVLVTARGWRTERAEENGVRVIRAGRLATWASTPLSLALVLELRRRMPDVTHLHAPHPPGEVAQLLFGRSRATVMTWHSDVVRQRRLGRLYRPLQRRVLDRIDLVLPTSTRYRESSPVLSRLPAERCRAVPLGVDAERFARPDPERVEALRRRHGTPLVLFVGRLRYYKGVDVLIRAMEELETATLLVVGRGPMEKRWRSLAEVSAAAQRIRFLGDVDDGELPALYAAADVFVLPSTERSEAYGLAQLEAMAAGTPVVSTELGTGTSVVNRDGETGLVVPPRNADALAAALSRLLGDDVGRRAMGERARQRAQRELSAERMFQQIDEVYRDVLERG